MPERPRILTRRRLLLSSGALGLATTLGGCRSDEPRRGGLGLLGRINERVQRAVFDPNRLAPEAPESDLTPMEDFPQYFIADEIPQAPAAWRLEIGGLVRTPLSLSREDLRRLPRTDVRVRHHCVEGWSAVASWHGVRLSELARIAGADPRAEYVEFRSFDNGYWSSWDRASALHPQSIVADGMNGEPLGPAHGAPARLYSAVKLGYKMVKYLTGIRFLDRNSGGYWEDQGYEWWAGV